MDVEKFVRHLCRLVLRHQMPVWNYFLNSFYSGCFQSTRGNLTMSLLFENISEAKNLSTQLYSCPNSEHGTGSISSNKSQIWIQERFNSKRGNPKGDRILKKLRLVLGTVLPDNVSHVILVLFPNVFICVKPREIDNQLL
jgi:hypothetical protein